MWKELLRNKDWVRTLVCNWITNQVVYESLLSRPCTACRTCLACSTWHWTPSPCPLASGHSRPRRSRSSGRCDSCWTCFCHSASSRRAKWGRCIASSASHPPPRSPSTWPWRRGTWRRPWGSWPTNKCSILRLRVVSAMFRKNKVFFCPLLQWKYNIDLGPKSPTRKPNTQQYNSNSLMTAQHFWPNWAVLLVSGELCFGFWLVSTQLISWG